MSHTQHKKSLALFCAAVFVCFTIPASAHAQSPRKESSDATKIEQELISTEIGFYEAWKKKDDSYFREHMAESGIFWGEEGTLSRDEHLRQQQSSAKSCNVEGYGLSEFGALPLTTSVYLLTYKADQYATCNGEKLPVHMNGSSIYVLKAGRWQAVYRAEVPLNAQP